MDILLDFFKPFHIRNYRGGKEIRVMDLEASLEHARGLIEKHNLQVNIIDIDPILKSFTIKEKQ